MRRKPTRKLRAACLGTGLAVAGWGNGTADAAPFRVTGRVTPEDALTNAYVIAEFAASNSSSPYFFAHKIASTVPPNQDTPFAFIVPDNPGDWGVVSWMHAYTVLGVHDVPADRVTIGLEAASAQDVLDNDPTWQEYFDYFLDPTESQAAGWLLTDDVDSLRGWGSLGWQAANWFGTESTLVQFSPATTAGTAFAEAVEIPEPAPFMLVLAGATVFLLTHKRRAGPAS
jgi:hypothetical protein